MNLIADSCVVGLLSFLMAVIATGWIRRLAPRLGLIDRPDAHRKIHGRVVPLGGGLAVFAATWATACLVLLLPNHWRTLFWEQRQLYVGLFAASCVLAAVGLCDDRHALRGSQKLLGQMLAVLILWFQGLSIDRIAIGDWTINLGILALPATMFWLLGAINALNLIDGSDGLAGTVGVIICAAIAIMAWMLGHVEGAMLAIALAGALGGFLVFNMPPASIFLGDTGSMFVGLVAGTLAISGAFKGPATVALIAPLVIWTVPVLDSCLAIIRRKLTGQSLYSTDRGHLHHCLQYRGLNSITIVYVTGMLCAVTASAALVSVYWKNDQYAILASVAVVMSLVAGKFFGYTEFVLVAQRMSTFLEKWIPYVKQRHRESRIQIHGHREWSGLWGTLVEAAKRQGFSQVRLTLSIPWLHESYYAYWEASVRMGDEWQVRLPLRHEGRTVGHLKAAGPVESAAGGGGLGKLAEIVAAFEDRLDQIIHEDVASVAARGIQEKSPQRGLIIAAADADNLELGSTAPRAASRGAPPALQGLLRRS